MSPPELDVYQGVGAPSNGSYIESIHQSDSTYVRGMFSRDVDLAYTHTF